MGITRFRGDCLEKVWAIFGLGDFRRHARESNRRKGREQTGMACSQRAFASRSIEACEVASRALRRFAPYASAASWADMARTFRPPLPRAFRPFCRRCE